MGKNTLYVAYGSNLNVEQMARRCPGAEVFGVGKVLGYRLAFKRLGLNAYATIEPCEGEYVPVAVWKLGAGNEAALDRYEGFPTHYTKTSVEVDLEDRNVRGMVYVMNTRAVSALPSKGYFQCVLEGYRSFWLDESKLSEAWERAGGSVRMK